MTATGRVTHTGGYYRYPTLFGDRVVFCSEDDLWEVPVEGGAANRLTAARSRCSHPSFSPDGQWIAFTGREEGVGQVFVMPALGGPATRLTFETAECTVVGWSRDGRILFTTSARTAFARLNQVYKISPDGGDAVVVKCGPAMVVSDGPTRGRVIGRHQDDAARWKRYRGGRAGVLWIDSAGNGRYRKLIDLPGNVVKPMWIDERIYFVSDHEGVGNLFSCTIEGLDLRQHTAHTEFYVRNPSTNGGRIVYHAGGDIWYFTPDDPKPERKLEITYRSTWTQRQRIQRSVGQFLGTRDLNTKADRIALTSRGKLFEFALFDGPVAPIGEPHGVRYRHPNYISETSLAVLSDESGEECLELYNVDGTRTQAFDEPVPGRALSMWANKAGTHLAIANHRYELVIVDLKKQTQSIVDTDAFGRIAGIAWSPCGNYVSYAISVSEKTSTIRLLHVPSGDRTDITSGEFRDVYPSFTADGRYLLFGSYREFDPVYDMHRFDLGFPRGVRIGLVMLRAERSPFDIAGKAEATKTGTDTSTTTSPETSPADASKAGSAASGDDSKAATQTDKTAPPNIPEIQTEGIQHRVVLVPSTEGRIVSVRAGADRVFYITRPIEGSASNNWRSSEPDAKGTLRSYEFAKKRDSLVMKNVSGFAVSHDGKNLLVRARRRLRVIAATNDGGKDKTSTRPGAETGYVNLDRVFLEVDRGEEWRQMLDESWRLMRDHFWTEDMSGVDWKRVRERYLPLVSRVGSRAEFSDLMWEMQGELGTSHAYEMGGDYRKGPTYAQGCLGVDTAWDARAKGHRIERIVVGDRWEIERTSPLARPGTNVAEGDLIVGVDRRALTKEWGVNAALVGRAGAEVTLTIRGPGKHEEPRDLVVKPLRSDRTARYRDWVDHNRAQVHQASEGRIGYVHIPDMGPNGYAEFHRGFLAEVARDGLVIDVRYNGGGHVSQILLERIARRRIGYSVPRWGTAGSYPKDALAGPMVAITNEYAGSDGDIFSHGFKMMGLGKLIGMRSWGGVVGIWPRHQLVDGSKTSQPEFANWFNDVEWGLENWGSDPDEVVDIKPQEFVAGSDPQLDRGLKIVESALAANPVVLPAFGRRPHLGGVFRDRRDEN